MDEVIQNESTYTHRSLASVLGRTAEWVLNEIIYQGCEHRKVGRMYFITGGAFQRFIESGAATWIRPDSRGKRPSSGGA